jgi:hypothetical protein
VEGLGLSCGTGKKAIADPPIMTTAKTIPTTIAFLLDRLGGDFFFTYDLIKSEEFKSHYRVHMIASYDWANGTRTN